MTEYQTWTAKITNSLLGAVVVNVRKGKGKIVYPFELPSHVRDYLTLQPGKTAMQLDFREVCKLELDTQHTPEGIQKIRTVPYPKTTPQAGLTMYVFVTFTLKNPAYVPPRPKLTVKEHGPLIRDFRGLLQFFRAEGPHYLNHRIYKDTECGASISIQLRDGTWLHCGDPRWDRISDLEKVRAFTIQTIVEGSEATVDSQPFVLPCTQAEVETWIAEMEAQADELWNEANQATEGEQTND